jgi:hypothetical protein
VTTIRYYIDNAAAPVSPAYAAVWTGTGTRVAMPTAPPSLSGSFGVSENSAAPTSVVFLQGVASGLASGRSLSGTMRAAFWISTSGGASPGSPTGGTAQARLRIVLKVVSADGATVRGVLGQWDSAVLLFNNTNQCVRVVSGALTAVDAVAGDRVVAEVGVFYNNTSTSSLSSSITPTNVGSSSDQPYADGDTTAATRRSWIELILNDPPEPPTGLTQTDATATSVTVAWTAPATGAAPTSYEYRRDGGTPVDVGLSLSALVAGLDPGTAYDFEVRTVAATGTSAWAGPLEVTTLAPQPPAPGIASQAVLSLAGLDPSPDGADAPAQQWWDMDAHDAETYNAARSVGLYGYSINYGSRDPLSGPQPITLAVQVMVPVGEHIGIGDRFRLRLSASLAAALELDDDTGAIRATAIVTDSQADPMVLYDLPPHGPAIMYTIAATGWAPRYASARVDGTGWPTEPAGVRIGRILDGVGLAGVVPDDGPDVLPPAAPGTYLEALAAVTDSINGRVVEQPHGLLDYLPADSRRGTLPAYSLVASEIIGTPFTWRESVGDIINTADVRYGSGTGESVTVTNPASADPRRGVGTYAAQRTTVLADESDASAYGTGLVGRRAWPFPQLPAVAVDLARSGLELARIAALFATRVGTRVAFTSMPPGSPWEDLPRGCFTEGYTETATAFAWRISLVVSDPAVSGVGLRYIDVPAGVSYLEVRNGLSYLDVARIEDPADLT